MKHLILSISYLALIPSDVIAQIIPDSSLGVESSVVNSDGNRDTINGGAIRNANLFHSFQEFNVNTGREAYFSNPNGIDNIFTRVTGNNLSNIQGVLGILGNANLFLINPNGILFGQNARLDVNGSFFATTADSILFGNGFEFSSANPNQTPLLTVDIPIGLSFRNNPGDIVNQSSANGFGLSVNEGETISLIGGNVRVENGGIIFAPGGKIELGGLLETGTIGIAEDSVLSFPNGVLRGNISVLNSSIISVFSGQGGSISVNADNFNLTDGSLVFAGIIANQGAVNARAGDIIIDATNSISIDGGNNSNPNTGIFNNVGFNTVGNAGNIELNANSIIVNNGAGLFARNLGQGKGGNVIINADENVLFTNNSSIRVTGTEGGWINLKAKNLSLMSGSIFATGIDENSGFIERQSGDIIIDLTEDFTLDGLDGQIAAINNSNLGIGNAGSIAINSRNIIFRNNGGIFNLNQGNGNIGNVNLTATEHILVDGINSIILNSLSETAIGNIGDINITAKNFTLINGAAISNTINGKGNTGDINLDIIDTIRVDGFGDFIAEDGTKRVLSSRITSNQKNSFDNISSGEININTKNLHLSRNGIISTDVLNQRNSGNININADLITIGEPGNININPSSISSNVLGFLLEENPQIEVRGGDITINTNSLLVKDGGSIDSGIIGIANGGKIVITASENLSIDGSGILKSPQTSENTTISSNIGSDVSVNSIGNSGDIDITTPNLSITNGANITTNNSGIGNAGNITINANNINIDGETPLSFFVINEEIILETTSSSSINSNLINSSVLSSDEESSEGNGGEITINTENLSITNGANITTNNSAIGNAGNINITAQSLSIDGTGKEFTELVLNNGRILRSQKKPSQISSSINSSIDISGDEIVAQGDGGNININTDTMSVTNGAKIATDNNGIGNSGNIIINATTDVLVDGNIIFFIDDESTIFSSKISSDILSNGVGNGGNVEINTANLSMLNKAVISTSTLGEGKAGELIIQASNSIDLVGNSSIQADVFRNAIGKGGNLLLETDNLYLAGNSFISASTLGKGKAGELIIQASNSIDLSENSSIQADVLKNAIGNGGNLFLETARLALTDGAQISVSTFGKGNAGELIITATDSIELNGNNTARSGLFVSALEEDGNSGELKVVTQDLIIRNGATINVGNFPSVEGLAEPGTGEAGNLTIEADKIILENGGRINAATQAGDNGNITLKVTENITLRENSSISARAFKKATGGDVDIDAKYIIAFPSQPQGNDIIASAEQGTGGEIDITAQALFGIQEQQAITGNGTNDIDASSEFGLSGTVNIRQPDVNPASGLENLTQEVVNASELIAQNVCTQTANSEFINVGKGGLAPTPEEVLTEENVEVGLIEPVSGGEMEDGEDTAAREVTRKLPAQGWVWLEDGTVDLVAYHSHQVGEQHIWNNPGGCR